MSFPVSFPTDKPLVTVTHRTYCGQRTIIGPVAFPEFLLLHTATPSIWVLELHNGADSRLTDHFIKNAILPGLDAVERDWRQIWRNANAPGADKQSAKGALIIVGNRNQYKFFSNGMSYAVQPYHAELLTTMPADCWVKC